MLLGCVHVIITFEPDTDVTGTGGYAGTEAAVIEIEVD